MARSLIVVKAARDEETSVWFVESSDLAGLNVEGDTLEALIDKLPAAVLDLIEESQDEFETSEGDAHDIPIELIAHASTRIRLRTAA